MVSMWVSGKEKGSRGEQEPFLVFVDRYLYLFICHKSSECGPSPEEFSPQYDNIAGAESSFIVPLGNNSHKIHYHILRLCYGRYCYLGLPPLR